MHLFYTCDYHTDHNGDCRLIVNNILMSSGIASDIIPRTGISITFESSKAATKTTAIIKNSYFHNMEQTTILEILTFGCDFNIITQIENCTFSNNKYSVTEPMINVRVPYINVALSFINCNFLTNNYLSYLLSLSLSEKCDIELPIVLCAYSSRVTIRDCLFSNNTAALLNFYGSDLLSCVNIHITGIFNITGNSIASQPQNIMRFRYSIALVSGPVYLSHNHHQYTMVLIYSSYISFNGPIIVSNNTAGVILAFEHSEIVLNGPITISENHGSIMQTYLCEMVFFNGLIIISMNDKCKYIMSLQYSDVLFNKTILFQSNMCHQIVNIKAHREIYMKVMEYSNITFNQNEYYDLIAVETEDDDYYIYPYCLFQYVAGQNASATITSHYSIIISDSFINKCKLSFYYFTSHCKWIPTSAFIGHDPSVVNRQIIHANFKSSHFTILYCANISMDVIGPVYPGQKLQVELCIPCSDNHSILYAETQNTLLPKSTCKVAHQTELVNVITNNSKIVSYTIVSNVNDSCELFLTVSPFLYYIYEVFDVQLLPCPIGFTLQNGVCDCDPLLPTDIDTCYIDQSAIRRPANTWISYTQSSTSKYLISDCPMDYCLPFSLNVNLLHLDTQCQFNRTGILCSQCQHDLSMVFGSSRCMKCTNVHILITIIVIVAGVVLVVVLYLLNLTVTNDTINGIMLYANIISINDSFFLINGKVFDPLRIFISFVNLDLGIETCFYNGMDGYAKMWLQLFFPMYLIFIAFSIIISSRYSSRILRWTYRRSLPVLATLFLLSYTTVLRTVLTVLFSYSTITHVPSGHQELVWSVDASVPLFGLKFTILFITCLVLFLILLFFNIILLFRKYLARFRLINHFKPILDAYQGSYKDRYYYWVAVHIMLRSSFFVLYAFSSDIRMFSATIILVPFTGTFGYICPYKCKLINFQELLLLINLTIQHALASHGNSLYIVPNLMISLSFIQFCAIVVHHFLTYTCYCNAKNAFCLIRNKVNIFKCCKKEHQIHATTVSLNIPECTYNYSEYQDGLVTDDFVVNE